MILRLLYLPAYFFPEHAASSYLANNRNQAFADAGFDVITYTATPCRGISQEVRAEYCKKEHRVEVMYDGHMTIHRFSMYAEGKNPIMRALRYVFCWIKQFYYGLNTKDIDCIYLASTPPIQGLLGAYLKKFKGIDLESYKPARKIFDGYNFTYKHADKIIVISDDFKRNIMAKGVPEDKIVVVYNWVDQNAVVNVDRSENKLIAKYGIDPSKFYIEYSGNIGLTQNMDMLLDVMKELKDSHPEIGLILVGEGAYKKQVEEIVRRDSLSNVVMLPFQPYEDISHVFSLGDVGLIISKPGVGSNSVPSKTWSIMSASRPVLANFDENEIKSILSDNSCGIFTKAGDKDAFKNAIIKLYENRDLCKVYGQNGRKFVMQNLTREVGTQKYVDVIKSVVK